MCMTHISLTLPLEQVDCRGCADYEPIATHATTLLNILVDHSSIRFLALPYLPIIQNV